MEPSKECDFCGYDLSKCSRVIVVNKDTKAKVWYEYCSCDCSDNHQDTRMRELEKSNDE